LKVADLKPSREMAARRITYHTNSLSIYKLIHLFAL